MQIETENYLDALCGQIRWKKARNLVRDEIKGHIEENRKEGELKGMSKEEAERKAAQAMGNPIEVGKMMDKLHRPKTDILMVISIAVLMLFGVAVLTAVQLSKDAGFKELFRLRPEWIIFRVIGIALFLLCLFVNFRWLLKKNIFMIASGVFGIAGLLFMNLTSALHGYWAISNDWLAFINYICICLFFISFSGLLSRLQKRNRIAVIAAAGIAIAVACILLYRDLAPRIISMFLLATSAGMFWFTNIKTQWKIIVSAAIVSFVIIYLVTQPGYMDVMFDHPDRMGVLPEEDAAVLKGCLVNVQMIGQAPGLIEIWMDHQLFPSENTMVYVLLKFGILPAAILIAALGLLIWRMISACIRIRDIQGRVLAAGLAVFITIAVTGSLLLNFVFIGTGGTYIPFLHETGPEFVLYSVFLGLIAGLYRRKDLYFTKDTVAQDSGFSTGIETA